MLRLCLATGMAVLISTSVAEAQTSDAGYAGIRPTIIFNGPRLSDEGLAGVYGMGSLPSATVQQSARDDFEGFNRFTAQTMPVTFENWFTDVATPLIANNLVR